VQPGDSRTGILLEHSPVSTAGQTIKLWKESMAICGEIEVQTLIWKDSFFSFPQTAKLGRFFSLSSRVFGECAQRFFSCAT
jgi:hypothetical protein